MTNCAFCIVNSELYCFPLRRIPPSDCFSTPAAGYRYRDTGTLAEVGMSGYMWASSSWVSGDLHAGLFACGADGTHPLTGGHRVAARPVRCVQASAEVAFDIEDRDSGNRRTRTQTRVDRSTPPARSCRAGRTTDNLRSGGGPSAAGGRNSRRSDADSGPDRARRTCNRRPRRVLRRS